MFARIQVCTSESIDSIHINRSMAMTLSLPSVLRRRGRSGATMVCVEAREAATTEHVIKL
jgi:hypothetical protein